ncbi:hypothetical protein BCR39DRAFT_540410 [Naematelia encephala]|uniref:Uncharacterized protein n=1 Tax=Naematelia encephala TaxID=71784 RepID=A0A1Y2AW49_9TREE|nr:hypothetical protein BCR39DRAFT_540410 [Naematelia encephala]
MSSNTYQPLPTSDRPDSSPARPASPTEDNRPLRASVQAEFNRPPPSWWKRLLLIVAILFMGWLSVRLGGWKRKPEVIYASRYSDEFKYRPAASPVITEYLKDGRMRLRGATIGGVGVREEDIPKTPAQKELETKKRIQEAREAARRKLGLRVGNKKGRGNVGIKSEV